MKVYHKPEMEHLLFEMADVLNLSGDVSFNNNWLDNQVGEASL